MMNPLSLIFGPIISAGKELGSMWMKGKQQKHAAKMAHMQQVVQGKLDYNNLAQKGMVGTLKDEFLILWFTTIMTMNFIPSAQPYMEKGWKFMNAHTPGWFSYCFIGIVVATFGLKGWAGWKTFKNGG
jgi:hypothetical protein